MVSKRIMLTGHIAVGLAAKRLQPRASFGALTLAAVLPDLIWCLFLLVGWEHVTLGPGRGTAQYLTASDTELSHSLAADIFWGALLAAICFWAGRGARIAWLLFAAVVSHWVLDFVSHRPDMALVPGFSTRLGLGLWNSVPATLIVEGGMWAAGIVLYLRATRARSRAGVWVFWIAAAVLALIWYGNITGPAPRSVPAMAWSSLIFFTALVGWAYWMNRLRPAASK